MGDVGVLPQAAGCSHSLGLPSLYGTFWIDWSWGKRAQTVLRVAHALLLAHADHSLCLPASLIETAPNCGQMSLAGVLVASPLPPTYQLMCREPTSPSQFVSVSACAAAIHPPWS